MKTIEQILIERDELSQQEAEKEVEEARNEFANLISFSDMYNFCEARFGLEPDYAEQLI